MRRLVCLAAVCALAAPGSGPTHAAAGAAQAVVAVIDSGINPYAPAFRDRSALATQHPSTYIPGYPASAKALRLSLDAPTLAKALAKDKEVWETVVSRQLYWIPGTKLIGVISMSAGGRRCARSTAAGPATFPPPAGTLNVGPDCPERIILDDHGHGTSTASRIAGTPHSLAPGARLVAIEGLGTDSSVWAAEQPWIDVQSNSWGFVMGLEPGAMRAFRDMAGDQLVVTASGNGVGFSGFAPEPTYLHALSAPGVIVVGGHDNGHVTAWSGAPAHVVADAFAPYTAMWNSKTEMKPDPVACCTSTSAPYVAGAAAAIILKARQIHGWTKTGIRNGVVSKDTKGGSWSAGDPLGRTFTLDELRRVLFATAESRPRAGRDDGLLHFTGGPAAPEHYERDGLGENPYCQGCWTLPLTWDAVPAGLPAYLSIGYGAINERSVAFARKVLSGAKPMPSRPDEDAFYEQDQALRAAVWGAV
ncbi:MAG TPA: S8/S53 family peptidase [Actinomycetota bacterium]